MNIGDKLSSRILDYQYTKSKNSAKLISPVLKTNNTEYNLDNNIQNSTDISDYKLYSKLKPRPYYPASAYYSNFSFP